jgi:hypothetical protein
MPRPAGSPEGVIESTGTLDKRFVCARLQDSADLALMRRTGRNTLLR